MKCFALLQTIWLVVALLICSGAAPGAALGADIETLAAVEELREQLQQQDQQLQQLRIELTQQREVIRRLPEAPDVDNTGLATQEPQDNDSATSPPTTPEQEASEQEASEQEASQSAQANSELLSRLGQLEETVLGIKREKSGFLETPAWKSSRVMNGRIHIDQWAFPDDSPGVNQIETGDPLNGPIDRLIYRRIRFGVGGEVPPGNMSYRMEIEFSGEEGSQFRDAWIGWDDLFLLGTIRLGNQKRPYGLDHLNSSNFNLFMERPLIVDALNENNRRFGVVTYGVSDNLAFNWRLGVFDINLIQDMGSTLSNKYPLEIAGRLASTFWYDEVSEGRGYGHLAMSGTCAFPDADPPEPGASDSRARFRGRPEGRSSRRWLDTDRITGCDSYQILGIESVINVGRFQWGGELMNLWLQRRPQYGSDVHMHGGYVYASCFLTGEHVPWNRGLGILGRVAPFEDFFSVETCRGSLAQGAGAWEVAARLSYGDLTDEDIFGGVGQSATFALNWYLNRHARLQWNYIFGRIDDRQVTNTMGMPVVSGSYQISGVRGIIDF